MKELTEPQQEWIDALRSGEYKQGKYVLHNLTNNTYCCLGVACDLYVKKFPNKLKVESRVAGSELKIFEIGKVPPTITYYGEGDRSYPPQEVEDWLNIPKAVIFDKLIDMNDFEDKSFEEIADFLEEYFTE